MLEFDNCSRHVLNVHHMKYVNIFIITLGRTHRSNQVSAPEYLFLISQLAGEQRFASTVAKRLESLVCLLVSLVMYFSSNWF